jgi:hypothetical protein
VHAGKPRATTFKDRDAGLILSNYLLVTPDACLSRTSAANFAVMQNNALDLETW